MTELTTREDLIRILKSLQEDWMLVDDFPDKDFLVLVNMDRDVMEGLYPKKDLIINMEKQGFIKNFDDHYGPQPKTYSYYRKHKDGKVEEIIRQNPHVYYYEITKKGKAC